MNLNKLNKDQLINKVQELKTETEINKNKSLFSILIEYIINYKNWLFKLTVISFFFKIIRKYSLFSKLFRIISSFFMFIFGISLYDIYGLDLFSNILESIRSSWVYDWFSTLLSHHEEIKEIKENKTK